MSKGNESPENAAAKKSSRRRVPRRKPPSKLLAFLAGHFPKLAELGRFALEWTRRKPLWLRVPIYALTAIVAIIYTFGSSLLKLPLVESVRDDISGYAEDIFAVPLPKAGGREFAIGVARIEDDDQGNVAKSLAAALKIKGVERLQINRRLRFVDAAELDAAEAAAHRTARRWLEKSRCDLMIWGQVLKGDSPPVVRLIFTPRNAPPGEEARASTNHLALNFVEATREPFEAAVQAQVLGILGQFDPAHALADQLALAIGRLQKVVDARNDGPGRSALVFAMANARVTLGEQTGNVEMLDHAVRAYQQLLDARLRQAAPLDWAMIQNMSGIALWIRGKIGGDISAWERAQESYGFALEEYSPEKTPREWALTQNNLGLVLDSLSRHGTATERLTAAAAAYRAALTRLEAKSAPAEWAMVQNNLGNTLVSLSERASDAAPLNEAIRLFREALNTKVRGQVPLSWAMTQNNLGNALVALGELESNQARIEEAVVAYRAALEEYTPQRVPLDWAMTQNNLGTALARLGERQKDTSRLTEAVTAFRGSLQKRSRQQQPSGWAMTQKNLGNVLQILSEHGSSPGRLPEAIAAYREARETFKQANVPLEFALTSHALGDALRTLGEREKSAARIDDALEIYREALEVPELKSVPRYRNQVQNGLWQAEAAKAELVAAGSPTK